MVQKKGFQIRFSERSIPGSNKSLETGKVVCGPDERPLIVSSFRSSHPEMLCKKGVFRYFAKSSGKYLYRSLFFNKVVGLRPDTGDSGTGVFL